MNTLEAIAGRRSIRRFKDTPVPDETIETILNAAIQAPSSKNRQPWRFVVVNKPDHRPDSLGHPNEQPGPRPRKPLNEATTWL